MNIVCLVISTAATFFSHTSWGLVWLSTITFTGFVLTPSVRVQTLHWHHLCWPFTPCHQLLHIDGHRQTTWPRFWDWNERVLWPALWDFQGVTFPCVHLPCVHQPQLHFSTADEVNIINIFVTVSLPDVMTKGFVSNVVGLGVRTADDSNCNIITNMF